MMFAEQSQGVMSSWKCWNRLDGIREASRARSLSLPETTRPFCARSSLPWALDFRRGFAFRSLTISARLSPLANTPRSADQRERSENPAGSPGGSVGFEKISLSNHTLARDSTVQRLPLPGAPAPPPSKQFSAFSVQNQLSNRPRTTFMRCRLVNNRVESCRSIYLGSNAWKLNFEMAGGKREISPLLVF